MSAGNGVQAGQVINDAKTERSSIYDHVDAAADIFMSNQGTMYPWQDAVQMVVDNLGIEARLANGVLENLVNDVVDPVTMVRKSDGRYAGVVSYTARDFYYETTQFHDLYGEVTKGVCVPCVKQAEFDHQAVAYPDMHQHQKQARSNVAVQARGSLPKDATATERRNVLGGHYLTAHTDVTAAQIAKEVGPGATQVASDMGLALSSSQSATQVLNENVSPREVMANQGISFDQIKQSSINTGVSNITVGASLVSGTTIAGNTAVHGGNQGSFNVEDFGTAGADGEVPTSDGAGNLVMETPGGGSSIWTEDGNSPFTMSASSSATYTLASEWDVVKGVIVSDTSSTEGNQMDMRVNGNTGTGYNTRLWGGTGSSESFVKGVLHTGNGVGAQYFMSGTWSTNWQVGVTGGGAPGNLNKTQGGNNTDVTSPMTSFTIMDDAAGNASITMRVFGMNQ